MHQGDGALLHGLRDTLGFSFADAAAQPDVQPCRANPGTRSRAIAAGRNFHQERIHVIRDGQGPFRPLRDSQHVCFIQPGGPRLHGADGRPSPPARCSPPVVSTSLFR
jgi:hypothetical protein